MASTNSSPVSVFTVGNAQKGLMDSARQTSSGILPPSKQVVSKAFADWLVSLSPSDIDFSGLRQGYCLMLQGCADFYLFFGVDLKNADTQKRLYLLPTSAIRHASFVGTQNLKSGQTLDGTPWCCAFPQTAILPAFCQIKKSDYFAEEEITKCLFESKCPIFTSLFTEEHWTYFYKPLVFSQKDTVIIAPSLSALIGNSLQQINAKGEFSGRVNPALTKKLFTEIDTLIWYISNDSDSLSQGRREWIESSIWFKALSETAQFYNANYLVNRSNTLDLTRFSNTELTTMQNEATTFPTEIAYLGQQLLDRSSAHNSSLQTSNLYKDLMTVNQENKTAFTVFDANKAWLHESARLDSSPYLTEFYAEQSDQWLQKVSDLCEIAGNIFEKSQTVIARIFDPKALTRLYNRDFEEALTELRELRGFAKKSSLSI